MTSSITARILLAIALAFAASSGSAQESEGAAEAAPTPLQALQGENMLVVVSKSRTLVAAYSTYHSFWAHVKLDSPLPKDKGAVAIAGDLAAFQTDTHFYAYSAANGHWAPFRHSGDETRRSRITDSMIWVADGDMVYAFGKNADRWTGISLTTGAPKRPQEQATNQNDAPESR